MTTKKYPKMKPEFGWAAVMKDSGRCAWTGLSRGSESLMAGERWQRVRITAYTPPNLQPKKSKTKSKKGGSK